MSEINETTLTACVRRAAESSGGIGDDTDGIGKTGQEVVIVLGAERGTTGAES